MPWQPFITRRDFPLKMFKCGALCKKMAILRKFPCLSVRINQRHCLRWILMPPTSYILLEICNLCLRVRGSHSLSARFLLYRRRKVAGEKKLRRIKRNVRFIKEAVLLKHILVKLYSSLSSRNPLLLQWVGARLLLQRKIAKQLRKKLERIIEGLWW